MFPLRLITATAPDFAGYLSHSGKKIGESVSDIAQQRVNTVTLLENWLSIETGSFG